MQRVTLAEWLVELYLNSISELEISMGDRAAKLREQFHEFLATFKVCCALRCNTLCALTRTYCA